MNIDVRQILIQAFNFGILFYVLAKFLFRPILKILDDRSKEIAEGLALAEKNSKAEDQLEKKSVEVLKKAERKAAGIVDKARKESKDLGKKLIDQAKAEADKSVAKQQSAFQERMSEEEHQFKSRVSDLVAATTEKLLSDTLTDKEIKAITKREITKLKDYR